MIKNKIIVFDLDDTLFYEIDYLISAYRYIASFLEEKYNVPNLFSFMLKTYYDKKNVFDEINKNWSLNIPINDYLFLYRNHIPNLYLDSDTQNVLFMLTQVEYVSLCILTDGREITQRNKIKALGLNKYFVDENIVISELFGSEKPSLANYLYFQQKYNNAEFIYVGDNVSKDFIAPNKLKWKTICLLDNGRNIHKQNFSVFPEYLPQYKISRIKELLKILYEK
jgi:putative hydrolase of the HAD superfamily